MRKIEIQKNERRNKMISIMPNCYIGITPKCSIRYENLKNTTLIGLENPIHKYIFKMIQSFEIIISS